MESLIGMGDMRLVFQVTDALGIDREKVSVPLEKQDPGKVERLPSGELQITIPLTVLVEAWLATLRARLEALGFQEVEDEEEEDAP